MMDRGEGGVTVCPVASKMLRYHELTPLRIAGTLTREQSLHNQAIFCFIIQVCYLHPDEIQLDRRRRERPH